MSTSNNTTVTTSRYGQDPKFKSDRREIISYFDQLKFEREALSPHMAKQARIREINSKLTSLPLDKFNDVFKAIDGIVSAFGSAKQEEPGKNDKIPKNVLNKDFVRVIKQEPKQNIRVNNN